MKILYIFLFFLIILALFLGQGIFLAKSFVSSTEKLFSIEKGQSIFQIAQNLEKQGLIKNRMFFQIYLILSGQYKKLQSGNYVLKTSMNIPEIIKKIVLGETVKERITIIEGWNLREIGFYFENKGMFQTEELWELAGFPAIDYSKVADLPQPKDFSKEYNFLKEKPINIGLEGYLFPDTYEINRGESLEKIVRKMLNNFDKKFTPYRNEVSGAGLTPFEIITMASLLEKEVKTKEEKEIVSGILWKRLKNNIPLQIDATITYITGKRTTKISREETQIDSSYNTYKYPGLPVGPICNPGIESILAALYPKSSEYYYYLSIPEGKTIFSKTLEEHNTAKAKYLK